MRPPCGGKTVQREGDAVITTLDAGTTHLMSRDFRVLVHQRDLSPGIRPQDKMQLFVMSFDPASHPGTFPIIVRAFWLRESRTVIVEHSLEEQVEWRGFGGAPNIYTFSDLEIRRIEERLPKLVVQALSKSEIIETGGDVTVWHHRLGFGGNPYDGPGERAHPNWAIRRALGLEMRLDRGTGETATPA